MASSAASQRTESVSSHSYKKSLSSKADPNAALREEQPTDPDRSNPTRPRMERPLDTIRGFEAAIEARRRENAM
ncbi:hypothetical protein APSETT444_007652 [Aspergillus pseudonomiae]